MATDLGEGKPVKLSLKLELELHPVCAEELGKYIWMYIIWFLFD